MQAREHAFYVSVQREINGDAALLQFSAVDVHAYHSSRGDEGLCATARLPNVESRTERHEQVAFVYRPVGVTGPGVTDETERKGMISRKT